MAHLDLWPHPLTTEGRMTAVVPDGITLDVLLAEVLPPGVPAVARVDGHLYRRSEWGRVILTKDQVVQARATVSGGEGSNPIAAILSIAVIVAASAAGGPLGGYVAASLGITGATATAAVTAAVTAVVATAGLLVVNAIFPPRLPEAVARSGDGQPEPLYSLSGGANRIRRHQPLLLLLGEHRVFPDLVSNDYTEFNQSGDQFLNQIFDFGIGNITTDNTRVGETPFTTYEETSFQFGADKVTLVAGNVDTIAGGDLARNVALVRRTEPNTVKLAFDFVHQHFTVRDDGSIDGHNTTIDFGYRPVLPGAQWQNFTHSLSTPNGPDGRNATRRSRELNVQAGQYDVRAILRTDFDEDNSRVTGNASVSAFRAYQDDTADFRGRNAFAVRIKATGQLYGRLETISTHCGQTVETWDGNAWVDAVSSNPAYIYRKYLQGWRRDDGRLMAGMGLPDDRIDHDAIRSWAAFCDEQGLECDFVIDRPRDHESTIRLITQCGWASRDHQSGKHGVLWEEADRPFSALVTPASVIEGSMSIVYNSESLADEIVGRYTDRDSGYKPNTVRRRVPGVGTPERPISIRLDGITNGVHAAKEVNRQAAAQFYHLRTITWDMPEEGFAIGRGDVVAMAHDLLGGSTGGRLTSISADRRTVGLSTPAADPGTIWITGLDGAIHATTYSAGANRPEDYPASTVTMVAAAPAPPEGVTDDPGDYRYMTFETTADQRLVRITAIERPSQHIYRLTARDEVPEYYAARTADLEVEFLPPRGAPAEVQVGAFRVTALQTGVRILTWAPHPSQDVIGYQIRYGLAGTTFGGMTPLHDGILTASPYESAERPGAGQWRFAIVAVTGQGYRTEPTYFTTDLPAPFLTESVGPGDISGINDNIDGINDRLGGINEDIEAIDERITNLPPPPPPTPRVPGWFRAELTAAQANALYNAAPSLLPTTPIDFVALAAAAFPSPPILGDFVSLWHERAPLDTTLLEIIGDSYATSWAFDGANWNRAPRFLSAELASFASLSALNLQVVNADISGTISADHIDSDVRNVRILWTGGVTIPTNNFVNITLNADPRLFSFLVFYYSTGSSPPLRLQGQIRAGGALGPPGTANETAAFEQEFLQWIGSDIGRGGRVRGNQSPNDILIRDSDRGPGASTVYAILGITNPT